MKKYGFIWKVKHLWKKGHYPSKSEIKFWKWLATHSLYIKEDNEKTKAL